MGAHMIRNYLKIAWRNLWKNKVYSFINVLGLTIGLSACILIYLLVSFEYSFENFRENKDQVFRVTSVFKTPDGIENINPGIAGPAPQAIRSEITGIEKVAPFQVFSTKVEIKEKGKIKKFLAAEWGKSKDEIIVCEPNYFEIFKYEWLIGNPVSSLKEPNLVVLSEKKAEKYFGKIPLQEIIGKNIYYQDSLLATVSGIVKDYPKNTDIIFTDFISFKTIESKNWRKRFSLDSWGNTNGNSQLFVLLPKNKNIKAIHAQFVPFMKKHFDMANDWNAGRRLQLQALSNIHFDTKIQDQFSRTVSKSSLQILIGIAIFLLIIAAINFVNLTTAQSINRVREIGLRKVLGSNRRNLIYQFLSETFLITILAILFSLLLIEPLLWAFKSYLPNELSFNIFNRQIIFFLFVIAILTSLLSGLYPAFVISAFNPISSLKKQIAIGNSRTKAFRKALITFQFTASQVFILKWALKKMQL
jgi:putative ABC transport system permease protein